MQYGGEVIISFVTIEGTVLDIDSLGFAAAGAITTGGTTDLTLNPADEVVLGDTDTLIIGGHAGNVAYNVISDAGGAPGNGAIDSDDDLYIEGSLEIDGILDVGTFNCTDCLDFDDFDDTMELDADTSITAGAAEELTYAKTFTDATSENGFVFNFTASDTTSGTTGQYGLYLDNLASTEGLDALLVLDNSDADDAVAAGLKFVSAGGTFTTDISLQNGETIDNAVNGTVNIGTTILALTGTTTLTATSLTAINAGATAINFTEFDVAAATGSDTIYDDGPLRFFSL